MNDRPVRDFSRLAIAIVVAAVVVGAGIAASSYLRAATTVTQTSTAVITDASTSGQAQPCGESNWISTFPPVSNSSLVPVFLMQPGSTATFCVTYQSLWQGNSSSYAADLFYKGASSFGLSISKEQCGATTGCSGVLSYSFVTSAYPSLFQPSAGTDYVTVVYTVRSLSNSTGFYDNGVPSGDCDSWPMAIGYAASQVNSSDFTQRLSVSCPVPELLWRSTSVSGMNVTYISFGSQT